MANAINNQLRGYDNNLTDSETVQTGAVLDRIADDRSGIAGTEKGWLDLSPFVAYMLDVFEHCLTDAALSKNKLTEADQNRDQSRL